MENMEEKRVDCCIMPEHYQVSDLWRVRRKDRKIERMTTNRCTQEKYSNWRTHKGNIVSIQTMINWYCKVSLRVRWIWSYNKLVHRLVYASFNWLDYNDMDNVWHHNDTPTDNRLVNLYATNLKKNINNKKLAYKLLHLYKLGIITVPNEYNITLDL